MTPVAFASMIAWLAQVFGVPPRLLVELDAGALVGLVRVARGREVS